MGKKYVVHPLDFLKVISGRTAFLFEAGTALTKFFRAYFEAYLATQAPIGAAYPAPFTHGLRAFPY
jgi:hypothetical protein